MTNRPGLLHHFFERSARQWPDRIAVEIPPGNGHRARRRVTYAELAEQARAIATRVGEFVDGECVVAILIPRDTERLWSAQLGVLQAGAAYTCIDPAFPDIRILEILEDSGAVALLTDAAGRERAHRGGFGNGATVDVSGVCGPADALEPPAWLTPESLAYTIYTSGTTGRPKAVMIEHRNIANLVEADLAEFQLPPDARVGQSSSPSYDSTLEEIWLAFAAGAAVVVLDDETSRLGPDLVAWLRHERITVLCPPPTLLRSTGCEDPEGELPELSFLYVGGEALPQDVADRWAKGRRLVNGYGPTECTVTSVRGDVYPGKPVAIGRPVAGLQAWVLDDALEEVAEGQWGELWLGGIGLARGYWNQPELTAERFVNHPRWGRIYRTGDLAHRDPDGNLYCHGRADSQVKIRGYRIELEEVEARLVACFGVRAAACTVQVEGGQNALVAFLVAEDPAAPPAFGAVRAVLQEVFPSYMVPVRFGLLEQLPLTVGGKLNRGALPHLDPPAREPQTPDAPPRDPTEAWLAEAVREVVGWTRPVSIHDDFFADLGGDSLRAAQLVTNLRKDAPQTPVAVRDVYEMRTVAGLAERMRNTPDAELPQKKLVAKRGGRPFLATVVQSACLALGVSMGAMAAYAVTFELLPLLLRGIGSVALLMLAPVVFLAGLAVYGLLMVAFAVAAKRVLIGRYRPAREPVWGSFYVRNWLVQLVVRAVPWWLIEGTEFQLAVLRALGARIGRRVHLHRGVHVGQGGWDLLEIGDDATVAQDASLGLVELDDGAIVVDSVFVGAGALVDIRAGVSGNSRVEAGAWLTPLSSLPPGGRVPAGERWDGIPARPAGVAPPPSTLTNDGRVLSPWSHAVWMVLARYILGTLPVLNLELLLVLAVVLLELDAASIFAWLSRPWADWRPFLLMATVASLSLPLSLAMEALLVRLMGRVGAGVISRWSLQYVRVWLKPGIVNAAGEWLSGTLFWPHWLRWAGMKGADRCEISTIIDVVPELLDIGAESFFADGIYLGGPRVYQGTVTLAVTHIAPGTFLGNHAVIPAGQKLPPNVLLGVCTVADDRLIRPHTAWFGHPPFELPAREVVECDRSLTHAPSPLRYGNRLFWETLRFALPAVPLMVALLWVQVLTAAQASSPWATLLFVEVPLATMGAASVLCLLVLTLKWVLLGRVQPGHHPLWSCWCSRWDFLYVAWAVYSRGSLGLLEGTLLLSWYLRAMGVKLGKRVVLGAGFSQVVDPDMLTIEDDATVNCSLQSHTFEDRVLKIDRVVIRRGATLGESSVPLYGADIGAGTHVAPHSVIMKHEHLLPGRRYEGAPSRAV